MRFLRHFSVFALVVALIFSLWASIRYNRGINKDMPVLENSIQLLELSVRDGEEALLRGLTAHDATDGDLTDQILVGSLSHFVEPGTVNVKYVVFDKHHNSATLTRKVHYTDYCAPRFSLKKNPVYVRGEKFDLLEHLQVTDQLEGDISGRMRVLYNAVSNYSSGVFPLVVEVSNDFGDTVQLTLQVTYLSSAPTVTVQLRENLVYLKTGEHFDPLGMLTSVTDKNGEALDPSAVTVQGNLDTGTPGTYCLTYAYAEGKLTGQATLTVVVTEEVAG